MDNSLFWNALEVDGGYPRRLTPDQLTFYQKLGSAFRDRAFCTSGVKLVFATDSPVMRFSYCTESFCRSCNVADCYENGVHTGSVRLADMQYEGTVVFERKTSGKANIEIWLPNTCGLRILSVEFGNWEALPRPEQRLLILGDSIMQGICSYFPTCSVSNLLCHRLDMEMINQSVGGAGFYPEALTQIPATDILVALGINDVFCAESDKEVRDRIHTWFQKLFSLYPTQRITCVTPVWTRIVRSEVEKMRLQMVNRTIRESVSGKNVRLIDGFGLIPHVDKFYNEDGVHPNDLGFAMYAMSLLKFMKE